MTGRDESTADDGLTRTLGLLDCVLLSVGGMVGSAIFVFPGSTGHLAGPASTLAWVVAGLLMMIIALCYTELALAFPKAGGPAVFPAETFGRNRTVRLFASYLEGTSYCIGMVFSVTISALAIAQYLGIAFPRAKGYVVPIALAAIALSFLVNLVGVTSTSRTNLVLSALLLTILLVFVAISLTRFEPTNYDPFFTRGPAKFFAAVQLALTGYGAWTAIPSVAEEVKRPAKTVPRAILLSLLVTTVLYTAVVVALHGVVAPSAFAEGSPVTTVPLGVAASKLGVPMVRQYFLPLAAVVAIFTTMLVGTMSASRVVFALGRNGTLPRAFAAIHSRFQVPWVGLVAVSLVAAALTIFPEYFYELLVIASVVGTGLPYALNIVSFVGLRHYRTDVTPPFRAPGGDALPAVALVALSVAMVGLGSTEVLWSVGSIALLGTYFLVRYLRRPDLFRQRDAATNWE
ncbi:ethanolamine transporter [Haladaptatus sp. W1]|uniref:APC family permease n=1 Tax=Haladaptatus sp. W1 TaxID=1897478 RepID=UPI000849BA4E|nr:APC family permease [Haladaptatus sp. W1]ODR82675.1 ethanolamine transporter [Haladaptatus sp. W1]